MKNLFKRLFITDWLLIYYIFFCLIWISIGRDNIYMPTTLFFQYLGIFSLILVILILHHFMKNAFVRFIRFWYPLALISFFFTTTTYMNMVIFKDFLDPIFQQLDYLLFGYQPALVWGTTYNNFFIQEFFHFSYFSYYILLFGSPFYVYLKHGKAEFIRVLFNILFVFTTCFIVYIFLPVAGGRMLEGAHELTMTYRHGMFTHIMAYIYSSVTHWGGAFPSSHVAVAITISLLSFRYIKYFAVIMLINTIFLSIATVFCHYHYFVDVIGGFFYGIIMFGISELIYFLIGKNREKYVEN